MIYVERFGMSYDYVDISEIVGKVALSVERDEELNAGYDSNDGLRFKFDDETEYALVHLQDCCEHVYIESVVGDLSDLVGTPILKAEFISSENETTEYSDSTTWTFIKFATVKGYVDVRFVGSSNGYYGETPSFVRLTND